MADTDVRMVVLEGVARLAKGARPTAKWRGLWRQAIAPFSPEEVRMWCRLQWEPALGLLQPPGWSEAVATAAFWGAPDVAAHGTPSQLGDWTWKLHKGGHQHLAGAAVTALGAIASGEDAGLADEAIGQLQRLKGRIKHRTLAKSLNQALAAAATARGLGPEDLQDLVVEDAGLSLEGSRAWEAGAHDLYLFLSDDGEAELAVFERASGRALGAPPKAVREQHFGVLSEAKAIQKVIADALATQKQRLELALESQRAWTGAAWQRVFVGHPLMRHVARRLVWTLDEAPVGFTGDGFVAADGTAVPCPDAATVRLAHPAILEPEVLARWQHHVVSKRLVQPFKQVFREVYRPTADDLTIGRYSERFSGQVVRHRQLYALLRGRGWSGLAGIGPAGYQGTKTLAGHRLSAMIGFRQFRHYQDKQRRQVVLEQLEFYPDPIPEWGPGADRRVGLAEVPAIAYSEVMRDLALVVGVAGLGPEQALLGGARPLSTGPFPLEGGTAMRVALVRELLPMLGLAERVTLDGPEARVAYGGQAFRLHLGTGEVHLESDGRRLDMEGLERHDSPLYMPHEGSDAATAAVIATLVWLAQYVAYTQRT
ncbi:MAG: DUF4132 domain-containing protein [Candidatus Sericytochromatia bacterium]